MPAPKRRLLALEAFDKEEDRQVARILLFTMAGAFFICLFILINGLYNQTPAVSWVGAAGFLSLGISLVLLALKKLSASGFVIALTALVLITLVAMRGYGIHDVIIMAYPVVTFVSVLVLRRSLSITVYLLSMLAAAWLAVGEALDLFTMKIHEPNGLVDLLSVLAILSVSAMFTNLQAGNIRRTLANAHKEIAQRKEMEEKLRFLGSHDILTGAYNRLFLDGELVRLEHTRDYPISVILSDMDNLKETNDSVGHDTGDELIRRSYAVLRASIREGDILARIGGDEFAVLLPRTGEETAAEILSRIRSRTIEFNVSHPDLPVRLSLGAATCERGSLETTLRAADKRMYADKAARKLSADTIPLRKK